jgi:hypothetical protein
MKKRNDSVCHLLKEENRALISPQNHPPQSPPKPPPESPPKYSLRVIDWMKKNLDIVCRRNRRAQDLSSIIEDIEERTGQS